MAKLETLERTKNVDAQQAKFSSGHKLSNPTQTLKEIQICLSQCSCLLLHDWGNTKSYENIGIYAKKTGPNNILLQKISCSHAMLSLLYILKHL